jgi:membrane protease YdiL (CAAX protease family)
MNESPGNEAPLKLTWLHFIWVVIFSFVLTQVAAGLLLIPAFIVADALSFDEGNVKQFVNFIAVIIQLCATLWFLRSYSPIWKLMCPALSLSILKDVRIYLYVIIGYVLLNVIDYVSAYFFPNATKEQMGALGLADFGSRPWLVILFVYLAIGILGPIFEEIFFRGILLQFFEQKMPSWAAILLSSALFGAAHYYSLGIMFFGALTGLVLALLYKKTGSIVPGILLHALNNTIYTILVVHTGL